jgi:hypothetical protein
MILEQKLVGRGGLHPFAGFTQRAREAEQGGRELVRIFGRGRDGVVGQQGGLEVSGGELGVADAQQAGTFLSGVGGVIPTRRRPGRRGFASVRRFGMPRRVRRSGMSGRGRGGHRRFMAGRGPGGNRNDEGQNQGG